MTKLVIALDNLSIADVENKVQEIEKYYKGKKTDIIFKVNDLLALVWFNWLNSIFQNSEAFLMIDAKYHDIWNTIKNYLKKLASSEIISKVAILTIHASIWRDALKEIKKYKDELWLDNLKILCITSLTSLSDDDNLEIYWKTSKEVVLNFANMVNSAWLDWIVCSVKEAQTIKQIYGPDFLVLTPWVRFEKSDTNDQKRVATIEEAVQNWSDYIVMWRPILHAPDMIIAIENIMDKIKSTKKI